MLRHLFSRAAALAGVLLALNGFSAWAQAVTVVEYYNKTLGAYFITGRASEQAALDGVAAFQRTGMTFQAVTAASAASSLTKICRFYIHGTAPFVSSHFYGRPADCDLLLSLHKPEFDWEDYDFATLQPTAGVCPSGSVAIYRGFRAANNGVTPNHRYSASLATYTAAALSGYAGEDVQFCVTAATPATAVITPPSSGSDDCAVFYVTGKRLTLQSTGSASGVNTGTSSFVRSYDPTPVSFNGKTATQVVDTTPSSKGATMIEEAATSWSELGSRSFNTSGNADTYYSPPIVFPKQWAIGQTVNFTRAIQFNPATATGNGTQTGTITLIGRESVTVPAGTFSACKFKTDETTQYPAVGSNSVTTATSWLVPGIGMVRSEGSDSTSVMGFSASSSFVIVATAVQ